MKNLIVVLAVALLIIPLMQNLTANDDDDGAAKAKEQRIELGTVNWTRDLEAAKKLATEHKRPVFLLFQEVPGCDTCQNFGSQALSHPLLVEAIEDLFIPVLIYNNKKGTDEQLLKTFNEPSWNNPVVRYISGDGKDVLPRMDRIWTTGGTAKRMIAALTAAEQKVPTYLHLVADETSERLETAEFAMHCYWEGEAKLGSIPGVTSTRSGWRDKLEVVRVQYDPSIVDYSRLLATAQKFECASSVFAHNDAQMKTAKAAVGEKASQVNRKMRDAKASDQKYYLLQTPYRHLPMTELQATKLNASLVAKKPVDDLLSPRQKALLKQIELIVKKDKDALKEFTTPAQANNLSSYSQKLIAKIEKIQKQK